MTFTKDPSTHPANGPLTEERLICVREWLKSSLAYSEGSNRDYMMADAAKAIDEFLAVRKAGQEPVADVVAWHHPTEERTCDIRLRRHDLAPGPLYAAPQLPQPAPEVTADDCPAFIKYDVTDVDEAWARGHNQCRAAMLQGTEPVQGWIPCSERMPEGMISVLVTGDWFHHAVSFWDGASWCDLDYEPPVTHWMPLPAAPMQEVKS